MTPKKKPTFERPVRGAAHQALIDREEGIRRAAEEAKRDPYPIVLADRLQRWTKQPILKVVPPLKEWAAAMTSRFGAPTVRMWHVSVDWLTALAIARYGEAEDFWPQAFSDADLGRAAQWYAGAWVPEGVKFAAGAAAFGRASLEARPS